MYPECYTSYICTEQEQKRSELATADLVPFTPQRLGAKRVKHIMVTPNYGWIFWLLWLPVFPTDCYALKKSFRMQDHVI